MSAMKAKFEAELEAAKTNLNAAAATLKAIGHAGWARVEQVLHELEGDAPTLEHEAAADAGQVVKTAETEGVTPAEHEAVTDAEHLAGEAVADAETAVADTAHTPAKAAAPGESAATDTGHTA